MSSLSSWVDSTHAKYPRVHVTEALVRSALQRVAPEAEWNALVVEDLALVEACLARDTAAIAQLDGIVAGLCRIAAKHLDVAELEQRVRLALLVSNDSPPKLTQYSGRGALVKWLAAVVNRTALNLTRKGRRTESDEALSTKAAPGADPERALMREKDGALIKLAFRAALEALPARDQSLLQMYYLEGFTAEQIAQIHQVHRVSVARWLGEAKRTLRAATRERLLREAVSPSQVDSLMRVSNLHFGASLADARRN